MNRFFAQSLLPSLILFALYFFILPESYSQETDNEVLLVDWESMDCDDTYDPHKLKSRITFMDEVDGLLNIRVNFADNCCADFSPGISFANNRLELLSATEPDNEFCFCDCCFSLEYKISGLSGKDFEVFFNGKKIEISDEHYETQEETFEVHEGQQINFTNKYGFREGRWMTYYENGQLMHDGEFPTNALYSEAPAIWHKMYSKEGTLIYYFRKDSIEKWFEDGEIKEQRFTNSIGDTSFEHFFKKHDNKQLAEKSFEIKYPYIFRSEINPCFERKGVKTEIRSKEKFYDNGQREFLVSNDTVYRWFENGRLEEIEYNTGSIRYKEDGKLSSRVYRWRTRGPQCYRDLRNNLYIYYYPEGSIRSINLSRDEVVGKEIHLGTDYEWDWEKDKSLTALPEYWKESLPWEKFELLVQQLKEHEMP